MGVSFCLQARVVPMRAMSEQEVNQSVDKGSQRNIVKLFSGARGHKFCIGFAYNMETSICHEQA